jgi:hypothetical protein
MPLTIRLHTIKCLAESGEWSPHDEPYVLITSVNLKAPLGPGGLSVPNVEVFLYGPWDMNAGDTETDPGPPFWGIDSQPADIADPTDVVFIVTVMENDNGKPGFYRTTVKGTATSSLLASLAITDRATRVKKLIADINDTVEGLSAPLSFDDDHVGTSELALDASDLILTGVKDKPLRIDGGDEGSYDLVFRISFREQIMFRQGTHLAALTRNKDHMEIWTMGLDGTVRGNFFDNGYWHGWYSLPGMSFWGLSRLAALSRNPNHMEVWCVNQEGILCGNWFDGNVWRGWYQLPGALFETGAPLAVVTRNPNHMEVWGIDTTGLVQGNWFDGNVWRGWYSLDGGRRFNSGEEIFLKAVSRDSNDMELLILYGREGVFWASFYGDTWSYWTDLTGAVFLTGVQLTALTREPTHMEMWAIDMNLQLQGRWFDGTIGGPGWNNWYPLSVAVEQEQVAITSCTRDSGKMEVWTVGPGGIVSGIWFEDSVWHDTYQLPGITFEDTTDLVAVTRDPSKMEIWGLGPDGHVKGNWFDGSWQGWYSLDWTSE